MENWHGKSEQPIFKTDDPSTFFEVDEVEAVRWCFGWSPLPELVVERVLELRIKRCDWIDDMNHYRYIEFYKDGRRHGKWEKWWNANQKATEAHYRKGNLHGKVETWHENGQKWQTYHLRKGKLHGKTYAWYDNGQKAYEGHYRNGKWHGKQERWYANGQKAYTYRYRNDKQHGKREIWYANGELESIRNYRDGVCVYGVAHER